MLINLHLKNNLAFKKGEREDLTCNYRQIALQPSVWKVFEKCFLFKIFFGKSAIFNHE